MNLKARLKCLEQSPARGGCPGCAARRITMHEEYELPDGGIVTLPPYPDLPSCTCGRLREGPRIVSVVFKFPGVVESREEAERHYAAYAKFYRPWQPDGNGG